MPVFPVMGRHPPSIRGDSTRLCVPSRGRKRSRLRRSVSVARFIARRLPRKKRASSTNTIMDRHGMNAESCGWWKNFVTAMSVRNADATLADARSAKPQRFFVAWITTRRRPRESLTRKKKHRRSVFTGITLDPVFPSLLPNTIMVSTSMPRNSSGKSESFVRKKRTMSRKKWKRHCLTQ